MKRDTICSPEPQYASKAQPNTRPIADRKTETDNSTPTNEGSPQVHHDYRLLSQIKPNTVAQKLLSAVGKLTCVFSLIIAVFILAPAQLCIAQQTFDSPLTIEAQFSQVFRNPDGQNAVILQGTVHIRCADNHITADQAVVWIRQIIDPENASVPSQWIATIYAQGHVERLSGNIALIENQNDPQSRLFRLATNDQVFLTSETRVHRSGHDNEFYQHALRQREIMLNPAAQLPIPQQPSSPEDILLQQQLPSESLPTQTSPAIPPDQASPEDLLIQLQGPSEQTNAPATLPEEDITPETLLIQRPELPSAQTTGEITFAEEMLQAMQPPVYPPDAQAPLLQFGSQPAETTTDQPTTQTQRPTVHLLPQGRFISQQQPDGSQAFVCTDGIYVYQQTEAADSSSQPTLLELRARNAVVFYDRQALIEGDAELSSVVYGVYLEGDVILQAGYHTIQAAQLYYDFVLQRALVLDAVAQTVLPDQTMPIYVRADRLRLLSLDHFHFTVENLQLTNDEFPQPAVWVGAQQGEFQLDRHPQAPDRYTYRLQNVTVNLGDLPVFFWPGGAGSSQTTSTPLERVRTSYDSEYGISIESRWSLAWLLGIESPTGVEAHLLLDEFTKRGPAGGINLDYNRQDYFGTVRGYVVNDHGQDHLGSYASRNDIEPLRNTRGRLRWQHRQYLPQGWQGTFELGYVSDYDFLESWEEREFDTDKGNETIIYFKQQRDHWAFDFLNKFHLNDFDYTLEEIPTAGFHVVGQDLFNRFTYHQTGYITRFRERAGDRDVPGFSGAYEPSVLVPTIDQDSRSLATSRNELSMPLTYNWLHFVPTAIGTIVWDDRTDENLYVQGAIGFRASTQLSRVDNSAQSRLWDINRVRHIVIPEANVFWVDSDLEGDVHRDVYNFTLRQRWQTMRGPTDHQYSVDFLRWNTSLTLVERDIDNSSLPARFFFSSPEPRLGPTPIINADLANFGLARREQVNQNFADHVTTDWQWIISPTTTFSGGLNVNLHDGVLSQADGTLSVQRSPRTSYAISYRFLHDGDTFDRRNWNRVFDSEWVTGAVSYRLNSKYTAALSYQYDLARTEQGVTQAVIIRKFHHWYTAVSVGFDAIDENFNIMFSIWPEGYDQFAIGSRRFTHLTE
ncbi:MAG: hypothetical protein JW936_09280 [Sedimentisphaerales bacterium]|nr:hypothetical protein [Sedimentisphaerales bacterium]